MFLKIADRRCLFACVSLMVSLLLLPSCKKKEEAPASAPEAAPAAVRTRTDAATPATPAPEAAPEAGAKQASTPAAPAKKRKVILTHMISLEVKNISATRDALTALAESSGGYVFNCSLSSPEKGSGSGQMGIRVPTDKSSVVLKKIRAMGTVESENATSEDVTEDYVDTEARIKNAKASEARLLELYQRAGKVKDMLEVEEEVTRVRGDIESLEAKKKNWDILTEMVTIEVNLNDSTGGSFHGIWKSTGQALGESLQILGASLHALAVFIAAIAPWMIILGPIAYFLIKRRRKKQASGATPDAAKNESRQEEAG